MYNEIQKTDHKDWDIYLNTFIDKKINCLEIGSYKGDTTVWMLKNLCKNKDSRVYSVDPWEESPGYLNINFKDIEKTFDENVKNSGKGTQNVKMKMFSTEAFNTLINKKITFDIIFIDNSHEAKNIMRDAVLYWDLLNENGILIFGDYEWDKLNKDYLRPSIAIDSFIHIYKPELQVIFKGYQLMVEKINNRDDDKPELDDYWKLLNDINMIKNENVECNMDEKIKDFIKFDFKLSEKSLQFTKVFNYDEKYYDIIENINKIKNNNKNIQYDFNNLIKNPDYSKIYSSLTSIIKEEISKYQINPFIVIKLYNKKYDIDNKNSVYYAIRNIRKKNMINILGESIVFLSSTLKCENLKKINTYLGETFKVSKITNYVFCEEMKGEMCEKCIINNMGIENLDNLKIKLSLVKEKVDVIFIDYYNDYDKYEKNYKLNLLYSIIISLSVQNINGCSIINIFEINSLLADYLFILKKYYKNVIIKMNENNYFLNYGFQIISSGFMGIDNNDLLELYQIYDKSYNDKNKLIINIIDNNDKEYKLLKKKVIEFLNSSYLITMDRYNIFIKIINYINNNNNISDNKKNMLKNLIYKKQFSFLYEWLKNIDLI